MFQRTIDNNRQDGNWLLPTHVEGRNDTRQESQMPPDPLSSRFSDWSSLGSPCARTSPHGVPDREVEQNGKIPNQLSVQSGTVPRQETIRVMVSYIFSLTGLFLFRETSFQQVLLSSSGPKENIFISKFIYP